MIKQAKFIDLLVLQQPMTEPATCVELHTVVCIEVQRERVRMRRTVQACVSANLNVCACSFVFISG